MPEAVQNVSKERIKYIIFGCGSTGYNVAEELGQESEDLVIVDKDEKRVEDLRDQKYEALVRDLRDPNLMEGLPVPEVAFILTNDRDANLTALKTIKNRYPATYVIARATDPVSVDLLQQEGADIVLYPQEVVARTAIHHIRKLHSSRLALRLYDLLAAWEGTLCIVTHLNPDPDSISSAMALSMIARHASHNKLNCRILYEGDIGHQENRAFINLLEIKMERLTPQILSECNYIALVDSSAPGANNELPKTTRVNIIVDHHKNGERPPGAADFVDIRPGVGATASIMTQYLMELDIPVSKSVATALLYGIRADTRDFKRNVTPQDLNYAAFLLPLTDSDLLDKITSPSISQETVEIMGNAIRNRRLRSGYLFSNVGFIRNRDALPQAADILIHLEGVNTALVYGISDQNIVISGRNKDIRLHLGNVMAEAFGPIGEAGGHATMAAAMIPLSYFSMVKEKEELLNLIIDPILKRFANIVGLDNNEGKQ
ncbi:MAG TPA: DHH family phosphoesterase [Methanoculleus sp.]|uniref:DHH family phosphoesterase n=1 Tax=Methanoculleus sp. TaxID=90427 RepID=UPI002BB865C3|nr:DHH family phosphoesterase [Methanoculleus sp.]HNT07339.1 DHH family phosphoesterase [Methanoculleus sp.]HOZ43439.1 DHH family phosphoesterase [Methanoculleus sp.]